MGSNWFVPRGLKRLQLSHPAAVDWTCTTAFAKTHAMTPATGSNAMLFGFATLTIWHHGLARKVDTP